MRRLLLSAVTSLLAVSTLLAQAPGEPDFAALESETLRHFQALVRMDTSDPPGVEKPAADYVKQVLETRGHSGRGLRAPTRTGPTSSRGLKGSGRKRPLLILGHLDTVNVDPKKWTHPPFSADRDGGYIYGRGTVDDKDNLTAALMVMLLLKRANVPLDRDVIFLAESGEEGATQDRHRVRDPTSTSRHRRGVLLRGGRRRHPSGRRRALRADADHGEDAERDRSDRARRRRPRLGAAADQRDRASVEGGGGAWPNGSRRSISTTPRRAYFKRLADDLAAGARAALPRRDQRRCEADGRSRRLAARATSRVTRRCCGPRSRRTSSRAATATT